MAKAEIGWKRITDEGVHLQVYVQHVGGEWLFYAREGRYDQWQAVKEPVLEDWLELLDAAVTTPDLQAVRHQPAPEDRSWLQAGARVQPTASVLGLVTELQHVADPCSSNLQLLRERYLRICHHYGRLVDHLPAGAVLLLDRAQHYRKLALAIA